MTEGCHPKKSFGDRVFAAVSALVVGGLAGMPLALVNIDWHAHPFVLGVTLWILQLLGAVALTAVLVLVGSLTQTPKVRRLLDFALRRSFLTLVIPVVAFCFAVCAGVIAAVVAASTE
jgi:hypothetical protein